MLRINENRSSRKYGPRVQVGRVLWAIGAVAFLIVPRPMHGLRCWILRAFGARVGRGVQIYSTVRVFFPWNLIVGDHVAIGDRVEIYNLGELRIGHRATISQGVYLCGGTHDFESARMELVKRDIHVGDDAWVCAQAFLSPGVTVGDGAVVGARSVVTRDVAPWTIVAGNPARRIRDRVIRPE